MFFLKSPTPLWFLAGGNIATSVAHSIVVAYNLSASISEFDRDIELSALAFNLSATFGDEDGDLDVQANIDLDGETYNRVDAKASIVPIFVLEQTGQADKDVAASYNVSASITASIFPDVVMALAYNVSASLSAVLLISDNTDLAVAYNVSVTFNTALQVQPGDQTFSLAPAYGVSASIDVRVDQLTAGGLVWSQKKQRYVAVRVGL